MNPLIRYTHAVLILLTYFAFFVRGVVPAGFMPAQGMNGQIEIVICTLQGPATIKIDNDDPAFPHDQNDKTPAHGFCPYAPVLAQDISAPAAPLPLPLLAATAHLAGDDHVPLALSGNKPWFSQGPPLS